MKKKLIAIVASLAMVATLVPATAFGAARSDGFTLDELSSAKLTAMNSMGTTTLGKGYHTLHAAGNEDNVIFTTSGNTMTLSGAVPYNTLTQYSTTKSLQSGNYMGVGITVPANETSKTWYMKEEGIHTLKDGSVVHTDDLTKLTPSNEMGLIKHMEGKVYTLEFYAIADSAKIKSVDGMSDVTINSKNYLWFGANWTNGNIYGTTGADSAYANHAYGTAAELNTLLSADTTKKVTFTYDTRNLTLLNRTDTDALNGFVDAVARLGSGGTITTVAEDNTVNSTYKRNLKLAQGAYDALTAGQKDIIAKTVSQNKNANYKKAYEALQLAQKNVEGVTLVDQVIDEIIALPTLPATAFADKTAVEAAFAPMNTAETDYAKLTTTQKGNVDNYSDLVAYRNNYDRLIKAYVDPIYAQAAAIDLEQPLTAEQVALIQQLKELVDGKYIDTGRIATFTQTKYDALVAALDKVAKDGASLENATIAAIADQAYTGAAIEPAVTVTDQAGKEVPADDYTIIYSNNKDAGTATVTVAAKSGSAYTGSVSATFTITPAALTDAMVKSVANATYTGKAVTPAVTVDKGVTYEVTYKNNTAVGKATATITGTGNYTGTITKNFIVKPAKEAISSLKAGKKSLTVAYKAQTGAKYRIVYSPAKGQAKAVNTTATKKTIKNLKAGKTYKVKVRAYKTIDGTTYNGTYSTVKKVKVK